MSAIRNHRMSLRPRSDHLHDATRMLRWEATAHRLLDATPDGAVIVRTCFVVLRFLHANGWHGAGHPSTAILHVLLRAQGIPSTLCMGEARIAPSSFDHSWLEVRGAPFDMAISLPLPQPTRALPPVVGGLDVETAEPTVVQYGARPVHPPDPAAAQAQSMPFVEYMDGFPGVEHGLWAVVAGLAGSCGLPPLPVALTRAAHADTRWSVRSGKSG